MKLHVGVGERIGDEQDCLRRAMENAMANLRVSMPGRIENFDAERQTATVQPLIREYIRGRWVDLPLLLDVPCFFPRAGGYCLTFPVKQGDECWVVFGDMCIDAWWQSGDSQNQLETRRHDLSDATAFLGITCVTRAVKEYSTDSMMLRNEDKDVYIEITDEKIMNVYGIQDINIESKEAVNIKTVDGTAAFHKHDDEGGEETIKITVAGNGGIINIVTKNTDSDVDTFDITLDGQNGFMQYPTIF